MTSLSMLCLDPYYRTMEGFAVAVEREWFSAGHKMRDRTWGHKKGEYSPIFLQFLDGTHQLIRQFPMAFEFNEWWLLTLTDMLHGSLFGNFLENSDKQRIEKDQAGTTESIWSFLFDTRYRDQFRSGMYMPSYYDNTSEREGLLGNGILCPKSDLKDVFIWRDYFLRWVEDPLRGCPPALRRDQRQLLAKLKRNAAQGKPDEDAPKWPDIYDDVPAPERVSSPHPAELTSPPPVSQTEPEPDMVMVEEPDMEEDERTETAAAAAAAAAAAGQE